MAKMFCRSCVVESSESTEFSDQGDQINDQRWLLPVDWSVWRRWVGRVGKAES